MKNFVTPAGLGRESEGVRVVSAVPDFLTIEEAAVILRIGRTAAYALAREYLASNGRSGLPVVRFGRLLRVPRVKLEALIGGPITWPLNAASPAPSPIAMTRPRSIRAPTPAVQASTLPFSG
jgi:hypothetical protein